MNTDHNKTVSPELKHALSKIKHVALDMDGTIYLGNTLFSFTKDFLAKMTDAGIGYSFLTNNPSKSVADYLKKLGFKEPIIAVWVDGEYYPTLEDMRRSESQYNIEISGVATLTDDMKASILAHKSDCTISRIGSTFVVGTFEGKSVAEGVVTELKAINSEINAKIIKKACYLCRDRSYI